MSHTRVKMSHKRGKTCQIESVRLKMNEHMTSVGEEISCVLDKQQRGADVCSVKLNVRVFVLERLSAAAEFICNLFQREIETLETLLEKQDTLLDAMLQPHIKLHRADFPQLKVSAEQQESPSLVQEEPEPPQIKEKQEDTEVSEWEGIGEGPSALKTLKSHKTHNLKGQRLSLSNKLSQDLKSSKQTCLIKTHQVEKPFSCTFCDKMFTQRGNLNISIHTQERPFACTICDKHFHRSNDEKSHMVTHIGEKCYICTICGKGFGHIKTLRNHTRTHTGENPFACTVCDKHFSLRRYLKSHMVLHTGEKRYICDICGKAFGHALSLKVHTRRTHTGERPFMFPGYKEKVSPEQPKSPSLVQEESEPPQIKEKREELLQRPEEADRSSFTLLAVKCGGDDENRDTEPVASTSTQHMKTQTDADDCGASQPTSDDQLLSSLHTMIHRGEKPFACTVCDKHFRRRNHLRAHMILHTGEKRYLCTICGKKFGHGQSLKVHTRTHTGERPYTCEVCGQGCITTSNLKVHMMIHTGEKHVSCTICGKDFSQQSYLKNHMRTHTGERPFTCTVCGKGFNKTGHLKRHIWTHTGGKPFTCAICGKGCSQKGELKTHMKRHTEEMPPGKPFLM